MVPARSEEFVRKKEQYMASTTSTNSWRSWSLQTKVTVGVFVGLAVAVVLYLNTML